MFLSFAVDKISRGLAIAIVSTIVFGFSAMAAELPRCCVWRVTNAKAPCYLVGTMHALTDTEYPLAAGYQQALHDSKRLVFEMNVGPESSFNKLFAQAEIYPNGDDIRRHVHPKTWEIIAVNFNKAGMLGKPGKIGSVAVPHGIQQLRPWAIARNFYGIRGYNDFHSYYGVDNYFARQGKRAGKELGALETDDEHVEVLRGMNDIESELILLNAIDRRDKARGDLNETHAAWRRGDTAALWALHQRFRTLDPGADIRLLDARNVRWVSKIKTHFNSGVPTAIVVGADHMLGTNGLIALLERNGYKFEQL
jgi:uncharacterized protein